MDYLEIRQECKDLIIEIQLQLTDFEMGLPAPPEGIPDEGHLEAILAMREMLTVVLASHDEEQARREAARLAGTLETFIDGADPPTVTPRRGLGRCRFLGPAVVVPAVVLIAATILIARTDPTPVPLPQRSTCTISHQVFLLVPAGTNAQGSTAGERETAEALAPTGSHHQRLVTSEADRQDVAVRGFYLAATETTIRQFRQFLEATGHVPTHDVGPSRPMGREQERWIRRAGYSFERLGEFATDDRLPVTNISWRDAVAYCAWLTAETGQVHRLPTASEWEHAARAGTASRWYTGDDPDLASRAGWVAQTSGGLPHPVASLPPNPWGFYDMIGNAGEFCSDYINDREPRRIRRGGTFRSGVQFCRSSSLAGAREDGLAISFGFRVLRQLPVDKIGDAIALEKR